MQNELIMERLDDSPVGYTEATCELETLSMLVGTEDWDCPDMDIARITFAFEVDTGESWYEGASAELVDFDTGNLIAETEIVLASDGVVRAVFSGIDVTVESQEGDLAIWDLVIDAADAEPGDRIRAELDESILASSDGGASYYTLATPTVIGGTLIIE
jgi:hypothetical protein